jgi:hypothetical protein
MFGVAQHLSPSRPWLKAIGNGQRLGASLLTSVD